MHAHTPTYGSYIYATVNANFDSCPCVHAKFAKGLHVLAAVYSYMYKSERVKSMLQGSWGARGG